MSYILDALKKSESERRAGATPGLAPGASYVVLPQHRSRHRGAALMVAVGMLGTGLALGNWRPWQEDLAGGQLPPPTPVAAAVAGAMPLSSGLAVSALSESPRSSRSPSRAAEKTPPVAASITSTLAEKKRSGPPPKEAPILTAAAPPLPPVGKPVAAVAQPVPVAAVVQPVAVTAGSVGGTPASFRLAPVQVALATPSAAAPMTPTAPAVPAVPVAKSVAVAAAVPAPVPAVAPVAAPVAAPAPAQRVVAFRELPAAVQGALPNIVFGGFAGGGETDGRIAFINNRLVREGEEVSPGLRLETVDQDGVVLGFQGHHFRSAQ